MGACSAGAWTGAANGREGETFVSYSVTGKFVLSMRDWYDFTNPLQIAADPTNPKRYADAWIWAGGKVFSLGSSTGYELKGQKEHSIHFNVTIPKEMKAK